MTTGAFDRWVRGVAEPVMVYVATAKAVEFGEPVGIATDGTITLPADVTWDTNLATTQTAFAAIFAGVSMQKKVATVARIYGNSEDNKLRIGITGIYEGKLASANTVNGVTLFGPAKDTGNALVNNLLVAVASSALAIAVATETKTSATRCFMRILSTRFPFSK